MLIRMRRLILIALLAPIAFPFAASAQETIAPSVIISEVAWAGSALSLADEWLELTNLTDASIDISGWTIDGAAASSGTLTLPEGSIIEPYSAYLIANYAKGNEKSALAVDPDFVTTSLSLSNSTLLLSVRDDSGLAVDRAGDGGGPFAGSAETFLPMTRVSAEDGALASSWSTPEQATPGEPSVVITETMVELTPQEVVAPEPIEVTTETETIEEVETVEIVEMTETTVSPEPAEESLPSETPQEPETMFFPVGTLIINELVSDPVEGQTEWVEIVNPYNNVIPLAGWSVRDASGKTTPLPDQLLGWKQFVLVENPAGKLNNDGDTVELIDPTGQVIDMLEYGVGDIPAAKDPLSLARTTDGTWLTTTTPTPREANRFPEPEPVAEQTQEETTTTAAPQQDTEPSEPTVEAAQSAQATVVPVVTPAQPVSTTLTLRLSELYPKTTGNDVTEEFIELINDGLNPVDLQGWSIEDASGKRFRSTSTNIAPGSFVTLPRSLTSIALNNTGDTVRLVAPDGSIVDEQSYDTSKRGEAFARIDGTWTWTTTPTPDEPNHLSIDDNDEPERVGPAHSSQESAASSRRTSTRRTSNVVRDVTIAQARSLPDDTRVRVSGTVVALPGQLGKQIFYLADEQSGIQIYRHDAAFPELSEGDSVTLTGTVSTIRGERRIKLGNNDAVTVHGAGSATITDTAILSIDETMSGRLVRVQAMVAKRSGSRITLEQDGATIDAFIPSSSDVTTSQFPAGSVVSVLGILVPDMNGLRIVPRESSDVQVVEQAPTTDAAALTTSTSASDPDQRAGLLLTAVTLAAIGALALRHFIPRLRTFYAHPALRIQTQKAD